MDGEIMLSGKRLRKIGILRSLVLMTGAFPACGQTLMASQTVALTILPAAKITFVPASLVLLSSGSFSPYTGSISAQSEVRTSSTGAGSLTLQVTSEFAPMNGPLVSAGDLLYQCTTASYGTRCSGTITASGSSQTPITNYDAASCTGGGAGCSATDPNSVTILFSVPDKSSFRTGNYTATITLSMSVT